MLHPLCRPEGAGAGCVVKGNDPGLDVEENRWKVTAITAGDALWAWNCSVAAAGAA